MATVYKADNYANPMPNSASAGTVFRREFLFTVGTAFIINDTVKLCQIPGGEAGGSGKCILDAWFIDMPDVDTGATPTNKFDLGDTDTANKFLAATTKGQSAAIINSFVDGVAGACPASYSANKDLILKVNTAPQVGATSVTIKGWVDFHYEGVPSGL